MSSIDGDAWPDGESAGQYQNFERSALFAVSCINLVIIGAAVDDGSVRGAGARMLHLEIIYCSPKLRTLSATTRLQQKKFSNQ